MIKILQQLNKFNQDILYKDINHSYLHKETGKRLTSTTTYLKRFTPEFRSEYWRIYKSLEASGYSVVSDASQFVKKDHIVIDGQPVYYKDVLNGSCEGITLTTTPEQLKNEWIYKARVGTTRGTIIHEYLENLWKGKIYPPGIAWNKIIDPDDAVYFAESLYVMRMMAKQYYVDHPHLIPIALEQIVGCVDIGVAGQVDAIFYNTETEKFEMHDYKTDKKIEIINRFQNMGSPLEHFSASNYVKYSLQLGIYKYLLEKHSDIEIAESYVIWFNQKNETYRKFKLRDVDEEIKLILNDTTESIRPQSADKES